mmetsp:Transcript_88188/g.175125  ORF Transcript_88188/g.175125 Transcript_88188/m.175125 type:complete len:250 (-) Transcript_88188:104-853(-)
MPGELQETSLRTSNPKEVDGLASEFGFRLCKPFQGVSGLLFRPASSNCLIQRSAHEFFILDEGGMLAPCCQLLRLCKGCLQDIPFCYNIIKEADHLSPGSVINQTQGQAFPEILGGERIASTFSEKIRHCHAVASLIQAHLQWLATYCAWGDAVISGEEQQGSKSNRMACGRHNHRAREEREALSHRRPCRDDCCCLLGTLHHGLQIEPTGQQSLISSYDQSTFTFQQVFLCNHQTLGDLGEHLLTKSV